ncbi:DHHA2 domain-containing protein [Brenneria populi]|uniref:DHHA2 domain-containing protein n=1 Tax=Brenneria populi TaxID=1505588 RepID=A0ABU6JLJ3_9GAMM|nr:DHHA2 domain-containing protein [Brenneria populi Li et al. 2015]
MDYDGFVAELLAAKTDLTGQSAVQLLNRDAKNYQIHGVSLLLSQIELRDMSDIDPYLPELKQEIGHTRQITGLDMVILVLTDITHHNSVLYFSNNKTIRSRHIYLPGMTSRKKEILPWLTSHFSSLER